MKSLSAKTFQCGVTVQGLTTLSGTVYLTALTNTATWDYIIVGTSAQGQLYTRTYAQLMSDVSSGITLSLDGLSDVVAPTPSTGQLLRYNGIQWANWTPTFYSLPAGGTTLQYIDGTGAFQTFPTSLPASSVKHQVKAGVAINKGQAVYVTSADGTNMIVGLASNASEATSSKTMGLLDATVSTNGFANVVTEGLLAGLDTSAAGAEGDPVWLGTGGNLIYGLANKPYAPAHLVFIGIVTRKNNSNGEIFVKVQNGFELNEIHDVDLKTTVPVNGHILGFDGTLWVNKTIAGWLGYTPVSGTGTTNYLPKFTGSTSLGDSKFFDNGTTPSIYVNSLNATSRFYFSPVHADGRINLNAVAGTNDYTLLRAWHTGNTVGIGNGSTFGSALSTYYDSVLIGTSGAIYFMNGTFGPNNVPYRLGISTSSTATYFSSGVSNNLTNIESNEFIFTAKAHTFYTGTTTGNQSQPNQYTPLFLSTAGNVGIGTTGLVPGYLLTINGGVSIAAGQSLSLDPSAGIYMVASSSQFRLYNNSIAALSVASTGNVLINTTTDSGYKLDVNGTARIKGNVDITTSGGTNVLLAYSSYVQAWQSFYVSQGGGAHNFAVSNASSGGNAYFNNVNVGIGTTSPLAKLEVPNSGRILGILRAQSTPLTTFYDNTFAVGTDNGGANGFIYTSGTGGTFPLDYYGELILQSSPRTGYNNGISLVTGTTAPSVKLRIAENGNVGIGITGPAAALHTVGTGIVNIVQSSNSVSYTQYYNSGTGTGGTNDGLTVGNNGVDAYIWQRESADLLLGTSNTEALRITSTQKVGIGTSSPDSKLHIEGTTTGTGSGADAIVHIKQNGGWNGNEPWALYVEGYSYLNGFRVNAYDTQRGLYSDAGELGFAVSGNSPISFTQNTSDYRMYIAPGGNIGIGTTSPSYKLQVNADGAGLYVLGANTAPYTQTIASFVYGGNSNSINIENQAGKASIQARAGGSTMDLLLNPVSGNVGIGTGSPIRKLHVNGDVQVDTNLAVSSGIYNTNYYAGSATATYFKNSVGTDTLTILQSGNVGIGTTTPGFKLDVNGAARVNQGGVNGSGQALIVAGSGDVQLTDGGSLFFGAYDYGGSTYIRAYDDSNIMYFYLNGTNMAYFRNDRAYFNANVGIGTSSPTQILHVAGNIRVTGAFYDSNNQAGSAGQILKSTGTGTDWVSLSEITGVDGSGTANYVTKWSDADTVTNSLIYDNGTNVGIGTTSPGYNFDVNGQVRVQDKLRVGTVNSGNGVVHMSSSATINPNTTTIVWAQNVSVGMCAFIEYYILNNNTLTDQRAGTIMVTWNQSGTPTIAHTETTTPDIGSTTSINFTSSLVGSDARINAVNSSANPYTIVMSYKYF